MGRDIHPAKICTHTVYLFQFAEALITIMVDSDQKDIDGRAGCNYERTCCTEDTGATLNWFGSGGGQPLANSSNIIVTVSQSHVVHTVCMFV